MPNYDYECSCGFTKEEFLFLSQRDNPQKCPKCAKKMTRLIGSGSGFILKGDGFYATIKRNEELNTPERE